MTWTLVYALLATVTDHPCDSLLAIVCGCLRSSVGVSQSDCDSSVAVNDVVAETPWISVQHHVLHVVILMVIVVYDPLNHSDSYHDVVVVVAGIDSCFYPYLQVTQNGIGFFVPCPQLLFLVANPCVDEVVVNHVD